MQPARSTGYSPSPTRNSRPNSQSESPSTIPSGTPRTICSLHQRPCLRVCRVDRRSRSGRWLWVCCRIWLDKGWRLCLRFRGRTLRMIRRIRGRLIRGVCGSMRGMSITLGIRFGGRDMLVQVVGSCGVALCLLGVSRTLRGGVFRRLISTARSA